jgi:hypothetical protein
MGLTPAVLQLVRGNALKADVVLHLKKAGGVDMDWLEADAANPTYDQTVTIDTGEGIPAWAVTSLGPVPTDSAKTTSIAETTPHAPANSRRQIDTQTPRARSD